MNSMISEWFLKKLSLYIGWIAIAALFVLVIFAANIEIKDLDIWLHLASGRYIVENFSIPQTDIFSATVLGKPWVNHEWLFQVILYSVYALGGVDGLITLQVLIVGITFLLLLFLGYNNERQVTPIATLLLVVLVYQLRFFLRPEIFSLLFLVLYICVLSFKLHSRSSVVALFFLQLFWVNIHGFFILGPLLIILNIAGEMLKRHVKLPFEMNEVGRFSDEEYRRLFHILGAVILAFFVNPHTFQGALYPFKVLFTLGADSKVFFGIIGELSKPFNLFTFFDFGNYLFYKLLIIISLTSFLLNYRRIDIGMFLFWLFFLGFSMSAVRNVPFFAFGAYFAILSNIQNIHFSQFFSTKLDNVRFKVCCSIVIKVILICLMINYIQARSLRGYYNFDQHVRKSEHGGLSLRNYPYKAVDFLIKNNIKGRFFNDFNSGAYLIGRTSPDIKVFIDGRTELYGGEFFKRYNLIWKGNNKLFDQAADEYQLTGAFLNSVYVPVPERTIKYLYDSPDWVLVYFDYDAAIFLRNIEENKVWIDALSIDLSQWQVERADLAKVKSRNVLPYRYTNRAQALYNMGFLKQAQQEAEQALVLSATDPIAYKILGMVTLKEGRYLQALELLRNAKILNSRDIETRFYLAKAYYKINDYEGAIAQLRWVLQANPDNYLGLYLLSQIAEVQGRHEQSAILLEKAKNVVPEGMNLNDEDGN